MWKTLCQLADLTEGKARFVELGQHQLAVFLHEGRPRVLDNYCPHAGGNLAGGHIEEGCVVCPWHQWAFQLDTGHLRDTSAVTVATYPARLLDQPGLPTLVQADLPEPTDERGIK